MRCHCASETPLTSVLLDMKCPEFSECVCSPQMFINFSRVHRTSSTNWQVLRMPISASCKRNTRTWRLQDFHSFWEESTRKMSDVPYSFQKKNCSAPSMMMTPSKNATAIFYSLGVSENLQNNAENSIIVETGKFNKEEEKL